MNTLADLLNFVVSTLQSFSSSKIVRVVESEDFSQHRFAFKVRVELVSGATLQVRLYYNQGHIDYAYQLVQNNQPVLRWDNKEHFPEIPSYPHHFHTPTGKVETSLLIGDLAHDLPFILNHLVSIEY
ncbi:MAG: hypothetical protein MAG431_00977 [Chloroflexi bacterium]|nr:hypothetical protein [Chloroflexota bacterium]